MGRDNMPSRTRRLSGRLVLSAAALLITLSLSPAAVSQEHDEEPLRAGEVRIRINMDGAIVQHRIIGSQRDPETPERDPIPENEALLEIAIDDKLLAAVSRLDDEDFEQREQAMKTLIAWPGENLPFYALLARTGDDALSPEQHHRIIGLLRERIINTPSGALGISMRSQVHDAEKGTFEFIVSDLLPDLPAAEVLRLNDRIIAVDGKSFEQPDGLPTRVQFRRPGEVVTLTVRRPLLDELGRIRHDERIGLLTEEIELPITLGSTTLLRDPETGRVQLSDAVMRSRQQEWAEVTRRFRRQPVVIELDGELELPALSQRGVPQGGQPRQEQPALSEALFQAILDGEEDLAIRLIEHGAPVNAVQDRGVTALHYAARATMPQLVRHLLERGAPIDATIAGGVQPIHWAARAGASDRAGAAATIDVLIEYGADINARTDMDTLPIAYAIMLDNDEWRDFLISRGAVEE